MAGAVVAGAVASKNYGVSYMFPGLPHSPQYLLKAAVIASVTGALIAVPTRLLATGWFSRMTPVRPQDYLFLVVTSLLTGLVLALPRAGREAQPAVLGGGIGTVLAVGCPVCNKVVVSLLGAGGAMTWFAPLQPLLGLLSVTALLVALRQRLTQEARCSVPAGSVARAPAQR